MKILTSERSRQVLLWLLVVFISLLVIMALYLNLKLRVMRTTDKAAIETGF